MKGITLADHAITASLKVYLPEGVASGEGWDEAGLAQFDKEVTDFVNEQIGCKAAIDVLDLDNDADGEYVIVLIEAAPCDMAKIIERIEE